MQEATVFTQRYSCFYDCCVHGSWADYQMTEWSDPWFHQILRPLHDCGGHSTPLPNFEEIHTLDDVDAFK